MTTNCKEGPPMINLAVVAVRPAGGAWTRSAEYTSPSDKRSVRAADTERSRLRAGRRRAREQHDERALRRAARLAIAEPRERRALEPRERRLAGRELPREPIEVVRGIDQRHRAVHRALETVVVHAEERAIRVDAEHVRERTERQRVVPAISASDESRS